ncbi:MAG: Flp pilus assembly protein TadG [Alphaproteobacteria bacterium]|jgi:Flp pilus assembly protein TadG
MSRQRISRRARNATSGRTGGGLWAAARQLCSQLLRVEGGSISVLVAFSAVSIVGLSAIGIDLSYAIVLQSRLQSAADSAALAAVVRLPDQSAAIAGAQEYTAKNLAVSQNGAVLAANDVIFGNWSNDTKLFVPNPPLDPVNAVEVRLRRADSNGNPVSTFLRRFSASPVSTFRPMQSRSPTRASSPAC